MFSVKPLEVLVGFNQPNDWKSSTDPQNKRIHSFIFLITASGTSLASGCAYSSALHSFFHPFTSHSANSLSHLFNFWTSLILRLIFLLQSPALLPNPRINSSRQLNCQRGEKKFSSPRIWLVTTFHLPFMFCVTVQP